MTIRAQFALIFVAAAVQIGLAAAALLYPAEMLTAFALSVGAMGVGIFAATFVWWVWWVLWAHAEPDPLGYHSGPGWLHPRDCPACAWWYELLDEEGRARR